MTSFFLVLAFTHYYPGENLSDTTSTKIITKQLPRKSNRKPVRLSSCEVVLQLLLSSFCAFKIRNVPENFSEAKRIAFSTYIFLFSLLCYHPVELSLDGWYVTVVDCVTTLLSAYGFLCCLFLPKMFILFFRQEMNDANGIRKEITQFSFGRVRPNPAFDSSS